VRRRRVLSDADLRLLSHVAREVAILAQAAGQDERASEASSDAIRAFEELVKRGKSNQNDQLRWAECLNVLGYCQMKKGDLAGAIELHQTAIARIAPLAARANANPRFRSAHADWGKKLNALKAKAAAQDASPSDSSSSN
jgi:tetratricopeptide (TPR) repeat protein